MAADSPSSRRFDVALSFPGEHRDFVKQVADHLAAAFGEDRVLYDKYHDAEFARLDLDIYLPALYRTQSELIVIFLCPEYAAKRWCRLEWRHIRQLIATADEERIMFLSFGNPGDLSDLGILPGDGYIDILQLTPEAVAEKILKRRRLNQGITPPAQPLRFRLDPPARFAPTSPASSNTPRRNSSGARRRRKLLNDAWDKAVAPRSRAPHVLTFVALGGEGKTSLVAKWAAGLAHRTGPGATPPLRGPSTARARASSTAASSDLFLKEALTFFGDDADNGRPARRRVRERPAAGPARRPAAGLLILDGLEPLQYAPTSPTPGELKDQGIAALLKGLAAASHGLCVVTTRYSLPDLRAFRQTTAPEVKLRACPAKPACTAQVARREAARKQEFEKLVEDVKGHALTLNLLGSLPDATPTAATSASATGEARGSRRRRSGRPRLPRHGRLRAMARLRETRGDERPARSSPCCGCWACSTGRRRRLPRRAAASARHRRPDRTARRAEPRRSGTWPSRGWRPRSCSR